MIDRRSHMIRHLLPAALLIAAALSLTDCSDRSSVNEAGPAPDVVFVGEPLKEKAQPGIHIIDHSFGGSELIYVPESETFGQAILDSLKAEADRNPLATKHAIYRFGSYVYRGLVKNEGTKRADRVTVKFKFRFENYDSTYVRGDILFIPSTRETSFASLYPGRLATYEIYSVQDFIDWKKILWEEIDKEEEGQ